MTAEPDLVGMTLGSYRILGELGSGAMGTVYRAEHVVLERSVAIKLLRTELTAHRELVVRFVNEAKAASAIRHPGIVDVLDFGHADDGRAYYVMEMLEGESLAQRIATQGQLAEREAARIAQGIARALGAAHDTGIVHRDLKPDNVFLVADPDRGERPKLLDFGIAKLGELATGTQYTQTGALMGTPLYMAPEQARAARGIDHRADLYSLGCILYEMLVGQPPFMAVGAGEIIALQLFGNAERPSARGASVSPALDDLVMRLLEKEPQDRPQSAAAVVEALAGVLGERTEPPAPPPTVATVLDHVPTPAPRARVWRWLAGAALAGGAAIAALGVMHTDDAPARPTQPPPVAAPSPAPIAATPPQPAAPPAPVEAAPEPPPRAAEPPARHPPRRDQRSTRARPTHSRGGSPIENDID